MQVKQPTHTVPAAQRLRPASTTVQADVREHSVPGGSAVGRVQRVVVWSAWTLLAALALALAIVLATLVVAPAEPAPPPPTSPMQFGPSMGHARPY
jgi:hypothetical protein